MNILKEAFIDIASLILAVVIVIGLYVIALGSWIKGD